MPCMNGDGYCDAFSRCVIYEYEGPLSNILLNDHHIGYFNFFMQVNFNHLKSHLIFLSKFR